MPYVWAAYRRGVFGGDIEDGLDRDRFIEDILDKLDIIERAEGRIDILSGETQRGMIPVGLVVSLPHANRLWPHVVWFPEASPRNKLETAVRFFAEREQEMVVLCKTAVAPFFQHICKYGVLRPVGKFRGLYDDGSDAMIYETV